MSTLDVIVISIISCIATSVFWYCVYYVPLWVDVKHLKEESDMRLKQELEEKRNEWIENQNKLYSEHRNRLNDLKEQSISIGETLKSKL